MKVLSEHQPGEWICGYCGRPWNSPTCDEHIEELNRQSRADGYGSDHIVIAISHEWEPEVDA